MTLTEIKNRVVKENPLWHKELEGIKATVKVYDNRYYLADGEGNSIPIENNGNMPVGWNDGDFVVVSGFLNYEYQKHHTAPEIQHENVRIKYGKLYYSFNITKVLEHHKAPVEKSHIGCLVVIVLFISMLSAFFS